MPEHRLLRIRLHAALRDATGVDALLLEVPVDASPNAVFEMAIAEHAALAAWRGSIAFGTDERLLGGDIPLPRDLDEIHALPPVSGG